MEFARDALRRAARRVPRTYRIITQGRSTYGRLRPGTWELQGFERTTGLPIRLRFSGQLENKRYFAKLALQGAFEERYHRRWLWQLAAGDRAVDLAVIDTDLPAALRLRKSGWFAVPSWIEGELDLAAARARIGCSNDIRNDIRRLRRHNLAFEVRYDAVAFDDFYHTMYAPHVQTRFAGQARALSYEDMMGAIGRCRLLLVTRDGEALAGGVIVQAGGRLRSWINGVKQGDPANVRLGALAALYYFTVTHLHEQGHATLHLGTSRPFLKDGALRFKRKWGMRVSGRMAKWLLLRPSPGSASASAFLENNPFIHESATGLVGALFSSQEGDAQARSMASQLFLEGLEGIQHYHLDGTVVPRGPIHAGVR